MYDIILTEMQLKQVVERLASEVAADLGGKPLIITGVLKGCIHFTSDLSRALSNLGVEAEIDFIDCASYSGTESTGDVKLLLGPSLDCKGKYVLLVDTILESGRTLKKAFEVYGNLGAERSRPACFSTKRKSGKSICRPSSSAWTPATISSSATAWTLISSTATCLSWRN